MKITIKEIAKMAGVSTTTVSMIINNKAGNISQGTKDRVLNLMKEHNYVPNVMARSLVTKKTHTIGLVIPDITNPFFPEIARGVEDKANQEGYNVIYCNTDDRTIKEERYIEMLLEKMVDGIIFTASSKRIEGFKNPMNVKIPVILMDREIEFAGIKAKITGNNRLGAYEGVKHLFEYGYKRIVFISGPLVNKPSLDRFEGYKKALKEFQQQSILVLEGDYKIDWGYEAVKKLIARGEAFDGIFCGNDLIAVGVIKSLKEEGLRVPEDVGVVGFDDIYMARLLDPELTTVRQPNYEMGYRAAEMLIDVISGKEPDPKDMVFDTELIIRKSTKER